MPRLDPFRGLRYDATVPLDQVIAPPYDVVDAELRGELAARHANNAIELELPEGPAPSDDRYVHAAELLSTWQRRGLLHEEAAPALYLYRMASPDGFSTVGVLGALQLPEPGSDEVRPHEETLAKPLGDRLHLLRATRANLSPIWVLSAHAGLTRLLATDQPPDAEATDDDGVVHQLWVVDQPERIEAIAQAVAAAPVVIADGHHRYQTARHYRDERLAEGGEAPDREAGAVDPETDGAGAILAYVVELAPEVLRVGAIHRVIGGLKSGSVVLDQARERFDVVRAGPLNAKVATALVESGNLGLLTSDGVFLLSEPDGAPEAADHLDTQLLQPFFDSLEGAELSFAHSPEEAVRRVESGEAQAAMLLRPATVELISRWARQRRLMPPKTTYFSPKPRTGMVFRLLDD